MPSLPSLSPTWRRRLRRVRWGSFRRPGPVSHRWGYDRGRPVDRHLIERFIIEHRDLIHGRVLEVKDTMYTARHGHDVTSFDVVDIVVDNADATIVADLSDPGSLPAGRFDCAVITQTLMCVPDPAAALTNLWQSLAPGGSILLTAAAISRVDPDSSDIDRWRFTPAGLRVLVDRCCPGAEAEVVGLGNIVVAIAFLHGLAAEELDADELGRIDPSYPVVTAAVIRRPQPDSAPR